ncbi:uncharacterized protein LOC118600081 [Oryzias melastigma]|uniref:uncharacterized protein LOC118600081 n=1 Tax=Oryzias melastigma TaxID=30732 RepID=UPI00168CEB45|nr:uncharacterized protein LOC118600081 [Oryzias melastigma]
MALLGSVLVFVLVGSSVSGTSDLRITAGSGDDVILRCGDKDINEIYLLKWTKPNLQGEEIMFLYRNDGILLDQDESFWNRVILKDPQMKDGDLSVVLENVNINDNGTYECLDIHKNESQRRWNRISTISLQVSPPPPPGEEGGRGNEGVKDGDSRGRLGLSTVSVLLLAVIVLLLLFLVHLQIFKEEKASNQSSNKQQNSDRDLLISDSKAKIKPSNPEPKDWRSGSSQTLEHFRLKVQRGADVFS